MRNRFLRFGAIGLTLALAATMFVGTVAADEDAEIVDVALVEVTVPDRETIDLLIAAGWDVAEYRRDNHDGTYTVQIYGTQEEFDQLAAAGFGIGTVLENYQTWLDRHAERNATIAQEALAAQLAEEGSDEFFAASFILPPNEVTIMRADYFVNYAGRFLSIEARHATSTTNTGPTLARSFNSGDGTPFGSTANMAKFNDAGQYMYHRHLVRIGAAGSTEPPAPTMVRVAASTGAVAEAPVKEWLPGTFGDNFPVGFQSHFFTKYMDPTEVYAQLDATAAEFSNIVDVIDLPNLTPGYQRQASATMAGTYNPASTSAPSTAQQAYAVVLWSNVMGHLGGNQLRAQFRNPGVADSPLTVNVVPGNPLGGSDIVVDLATNASGALASTGAQVRDAINADPAASALVSANLWTTNTGAGVVQPRAMVALSDLLNAPAHVQRGPFQPKVYRIGKVRDGSKVGVYLFCQQHAREWVTPITCLETVERLVRNYSHDPLTTELVDNLDIFILPSFNPDGSHTSLYDFQSKRRNMVNYCAPNAAASMPSGRNSIGVDLNRNALSYTGFMGYDGASTSCTSDVFRGPASGSEPETKNDLWIVDTFSNIKFSNNIHTSGGYFMWAPGSYIAAGRVTAPAPNIGVEGYFFQAGDLVLKRIKEYRGTVVLPQRTGPIADVLYSAAGNTADDHWYRKGIIAYSFEAGADRFSSTTTGTGQSGVGFFPNYANEGRHEAMEFANGNYGLLESALAYAYDNEPPVVRMNALNSATQTAWGYASPDPIEATFDWVNEPSIINYTDDGSAAGPGSTLWDAEGPRQPGQRFQYDEPTLVRWLATDIKGNESTGETLFVIGTFSGYTGFGDPINAGTNSAKAGSTVPVKFGLGGYFGLNVLEGGRPSSVQVDCTTGAAIGSPAPADSPGSTTFRYDDTLGQYVFNWQTDRSWSGTCRNLVVELVDGTVHSATFRFS